jgi:hypothetical protein
MSNDDGCGPGMGRHPTTHSPATENSGLGAPLFIARESDGGFHNGRDFRQQTVTLNAWRRSQWAHDLRARRRRVRELDVLCGRERPCLVPVPDDVDLYAVTGMTLGLAERVAAGRQISYVGPVAA